MRVFLNAGNLNGAGAMGVGVSLLPALVANFPRIEFHALVSDREEFRRLRLEDSCTVEYVPFQPGSRNDWNRLRQLYFGLPRRIKDFDQCLTLGDVGPLRMSARHTVYLQQALLVYPQSELGAARVWSPLKTAYLATHFRALCKRLEHLIVQTDVIGERVARMYPIPKEKISVIPPAVPSGLLQDSIQATRHPVTNGCSSPKRLLFLSAYYPHKNHAILPALVEELRKRGMSRDVHIFVTLDESTVPRELLSKLQHCSDIVTNLGRLSRHEVAAALNSSTALFLPSLVESYTLVYLEAMSHGLPVLTSDRDFARWICRDQAFYFEPTNAASIVQSIEKLPNDIQHEQYREFATQNLKRFPASWKEVAKCIGDVMNFS